MKIIHSPCVSQCALDESKTYCIGCKRTKEQIGSWLHYSEKEQKQIIKDLNREMNTHFKVNTVGKDYFVGDLHGMYDEFIQGLEEVKFNPEVDRMFSVGDLGDRGPKSVECFMLLKEPWFHAVKGNHEAFLLGSHTNYVWCYNGGQWWYDVPKVLQKEIVLLVEQMPRTITVETKKGLVGVVHAESAKVWEQNKNLLEEERNLWSRTKIKSSDESIVEGIDLVVVGHTPIKKVIKLGNTVYIDTGSVFTSEIPTILDVEDLFKI